MKRISSFLTVLLLLLSCTGEDRYERLLCHFEECNRNDIPLSVDSVLPVVQHYDHPWHSRLHRLRAYYMLGSAYRDQGEAPAALHYYNIAVQQADTAHADSATCATLFRVYGQMATIYGQQNMPQEELEAWDGYSRYALMAGDTMSHIYGYTMKGGPYYEMDDTAKVFQTAWEVHRMYKAHGYPQLAADVFHNIIYIYLKEGHPDKAKPLMDLFEQEMGVVDSLGNIEAGRELYYEFKGLYYLGIHKLDSAECFYRKLQQTKYVYEASKGLLAIFTERGNTDSITKYAPLTEDALLQWATKRQAEAVIQSSAMYNYERNRKMAAENARKADRLTFLCIIIGIAAIICVYSISRYHRIRRQQQWEKLRELDRRYMSAINEHAQLTEDFKILRKAYENSEASAEAKVLIEKKQERILQLEGQLGKYRENVSLLNYREREKLLEGNETVTYFHRKTKITPNWKAPSGRQWKALLDVYAQYMPLSSARMDKAGLSRQEILVCILTHLCFIPRDIASLLETSGPRVSNAKKSACNKLFGCEDIGRLHQQLTDLECG